MGAGKNKLPFKKLIQLKGKYIEGVWEHLKQWNPDKEGFNSDICMDFNEFNKVYVSHRPVIVKCDERSGVPVANFAGLYSAMKMALDRKDLANVQLIYSRFDKDILLPGDKAICPAKERDFINGRLSDHTLEKMTLRNKKGTGDVDNVVFWLLSDYMGADTTDILLNLLNTTNCFKDYNRDGHNVQVMVMVQSSPDNWKSLKELYPKLIYIESTPEKKFIDEWLKENDSFLDPLFDIKISDPSLDLKKVYLYMATNHRYKFREYAKMNRDELLRHINRDDVNELIG